MSTNTLPKIVPRREARPEELRLVRLYEPILKTLHGFGGEVGDALRAHPDLADLHRLGETVHRLFQKWNLEILYLAALRDGVRFNQLQQSLPGISSRTLSLKLRQLEEDGYLDRTVSHDRPLRVTYTATALGRTLARLTVPLVMLLRFLEDGWIRFDAAPARGNRLA